MKIKLYNTISFNYIKLKLTQYLGFHGIDYIRNWIRIHNSIEYRFPSLKISLM